MKLQDLVKVIRTRWATICVTALVAILASIAYTLLQTPLYQSSTRLFVSASSGASAAEVYQGSRYSQERVFSYVQLIMGETLAQRTIDRLDLDMTTKDLQENVTAKPRPDTVLIEITVLDPSPVRARDIANALSDEFVLMARELETPAKGASPDARVVVEQRASVAEKPVIPKRLRNLAVGATLGIMLGFGLAVLRELLDNTVKSQEILEEITGAGAVGFIPFDKNIAEVPTISFDDDNSAIAEAFRKLRTNLQFLGVDNPPRVIVVSSTTPSEGKSTTAINIALALAEAEHSVALVDGDLRRPRLAKSLDLVESVGLSTVLSGRTPLTEALQKTKFAGVTVLTAGAIPPNPSELLGSIAAQTLFNDLRAQFDYVIVDSPPLLAVTDGAILAAETDGVLVAVRAGRTKRDHLAHAIGMLKDVRAPVLGAVLTMMPTRGGGAYSYNYYYYGDGYGSDKSAKPQLPSSDFAENEPGTSAHATDADSKSQEYTTVVQPPPGP